MKNITLKKSEKTELTEREIEFYQAGMIKGVRIGMFIGSFIFIWAAILL